MEVDLVVIPDELEDSDVEATGERHTILCHTDGVVLNVWTPKGTNCVYRVLLWNVVVIRCV